MGKYFNKYAQTKEQQAVKDYISKSFIGQYGRPITSDVTGNPLKPGYGTIINQPAEFFGRMYGNTDIVYDQSDPRLKSNDWKTKARFNIGEIGLGTGISMYRNGDLDSNSGEYKYYFDNRGHVRSERTKHTPQ